MVAGHLKSAVVAGLPWLFYFSPSGNQTCVFIVCLFILVFSPRGKGGSKLVAYFLAVTLLKHSGAEMCSENNGQVSILDISTNTEP